MRTGCCAGAVSSFWSKTMAQLDAVSDCALPAPCDELEEWIDDRQRAIDSCFKNRRASSDLDCRVWQHNYRFKSIEAWPLDACVVIRERKSECVAGKPQSCPLLGGHPQLARSARQRSGNPFPGRSAGLAPILRRPWRSSSPRTPRGLDREAAA